MNVKMTVSADRPAKKNRVPLPPASARRASRPVSGKNLKFLELFLIHPSPSSRSQRPGFDFPAVQIPAQFARPVLLRKGSGLDIDIWAMAWHEKGSSSVGVGSVYWS